MVERVALAKKTNAKGAGRGDAKSDALVRKGGTAILSLEPFEALGKKVRAEVEAEGEAIARFVEEGAKGVEVKVVR